jgi:hypothetical protein
MRFLHCKTAHSCVFCIAKQHTGHKMYEFEMKKTQ